MHDWGEENFDWVGLNSAIVFIAKRLLKIRMNVYDYKEKYGTARISVYMGWHQLHSITHPGHVYSRYPKWLWNIDCMYLSKIFSKINVLIIPIHKYWYKDTYKKAIKKWPHLKEEIICQADYYELLEKIDD